MAPPPTISVQDNDTAIKWLQKSVEKGSAAGRNNLGYMYLNGYGVKKNAEMALNLFSQAATLGLPDAQYNLGELYFLGQGTRADYRKAMHFFTLAAQVSQEHTGRKCKALSCFFFFFNSFAQPNFPWVQFPRGSLDMSWPWLDWETCMPIV